MEEFNPIWEVIKLEGADHIKNLPRAQKDQRAVEARRNREQMLKGLAFVLHHIQIPTDFNIESFPRKVQNKEEELIPRGTTVLVSRHILSPTPPTSPVT